jgi:hypothetical protein
VSFRLESDGFELEIEIEPLDRVYIHEEIIPEPLEELVKDLRASGEARNPVIVDSNTYVVLDGMHRVAALQKIGCRYLPVCLVDYRDPRVRVGCWHRVLKGKGDESKFLDVFRLLGLVVNHSNLVEAIDALEVRSAISAFLTVDGCRLLKASVTGIRDIYAWVKRLERAIRGEGFEIEYERDSEAEEMVFSGKAWAALLVPRVRKEEVLQAALSGNVFAHKTTRHVVPARPMNVCVPIEWLLGERSLEEVNDLLVKKLSKKRVESIPAGSFFDGRRYEEELLAFR